MLQITGYDKGGNIKAVIDGANYKFATTEFYGGATVYGIAFPETSDQFTFISRSKKAEKFFTIHSETINSYLKNNPHKEN